MAGCRCRQDLRGRDGNEEKPRPLKAFRLADEMGAAPARASAGESSRSAGASEAHLPAIRRLEAHRPPKAPDRLPLPGEGAAARPAPPPGDGYAVLSVTPAGEGEAVAVVLAQPDPEGEKPLRVKLYLLLEQYAGMGVKPGAVTLEEAEALLEAGRLCAAIRRGLGLLQYGSPSARRLAYKLTAKGIEAEVAKAAVDYLAEKGYIREEDSASLRAEQGLRKGWGHRRIQEDLRAHGFAEESVREALAALSDTDWEESCAAVIRKRYGSVPEDRAARQKMTAALMRLGYDSDEIREAMRRLLRQNM